MRAWRALARPGTIASAKREAEFIAARNSLYMATVSETGWPYIQHRGGPTGFVRVLDETTIGFADFRGNRQYVSVGNLMTDDRVSLFFMDYPNKTRLKLFGRAKIVGLDDEATLSRLETAGLPRPRRTRLPDQGRGVRLELPAAYHRALHARRGARDDGAAHLADRRTRGGTRPMPAVRWCDCLSCQAADSMIKKVKEATRWVRA